MPLIDILSKSAPEVFSRKKSMRFGGKQRSNWGHEEKSSICTRAQFYSKNASIVFVRLFAQARYRVAKISDVILDTIAEIPGNSLRSFEESRGCKPTTTLPSLQISTYSLALLLAHANLVSNNGG
jgi:hypothetical protein